MALTLAAATLGAAAIGAGTAVYGASQANKAANKANAAQQQAAAQQLAAQQAALDRITALNEPFRAGGLVAFDQLVQQYTGGAPAPQGGGSDVLRGPPVAGAPKPPGGPAGVSPAEPAPDYQGYLAANPDVKANFDQQNSTPEGQAYLKSIDSLTPGGPEEDLAAAHYQQFGQTEGRQLPTQAPAAQAPATTDAAGRPLMPSAPDMGQRQNIAMGDYGSAPGAFSVNYQDIANDPGFKFETSEASKNTNANFGARGLLRSGDAAKALQDRLYGVAHTYGQNYFNRALQGFNANRSAFESDRSFQGNLWNQQQQRSDANYGADRAFNMGQWQYGVDRNDRNFAADRQNVNSREDTRVGNLFDLARIGQNAAGAVGGANANFANNAGNIFGSQANASADAAYARANANAGLVGNLASTATNLFANWGGGSGGGGYAPVNAVNLGGPSAQSVFGNNYRPVF
jgi:hypothetical protein